MTIKQRKEREKEQFRVSVIQVAYELVKQAGLEGLSLRKLATGLEYSTSKIYQEFKGKQDLIILLAEDICQRQNERLQSLQQEVNAEKHLLQFTHQAVCFYAEEPWSAGVLSAIRFKGQPNEMPPAFKKAAENFRNCVEALNLSVLATAEGLNEGLNVTRALMLGALSILRPDSTETEKALVIKIVDNGMQLIVAGWKSFSSNKGKSNEK